MRRTLIIVAVAIVILGLGVFAYFYLQSNSASVAVVPGGGTTLPTSGNQTGTQNTGGTTGGTTGVVRTNPPGAPQRLVEIDRGPVVPGMAIVPIKTVVAGSASSTVSDISVKYLARQSGNVFSYLERAGTLTRTSNKTIPGIEEASWLPDGSFALARYLSDPSFSTVNTYALSAGGFGGYFLPQNTTGLAVSSTSILQTASGVNGSVVTLTHQDGTAAKQLFTTPLSSIRASFAGKKYLVFTKPSSTLDGLAYLVDSAGHFSRIAGPLKGLAALASPDGKWLLVSYTDTGAMKTELINTVTGLALSLPVGTIIDKCAWAQDNSAVYCGVPVTPSNSYAYPDDWYQGAAHFSDKIWKIDVVARYAQLVLDFTKETKGNLDATNLTLDSANSVLVFLNKNDGSLWSYQL